MQEIIMDGLQGRMEFRFTISASTVLILAWIALHNLNGLWK